MNNPTEQSLQTAAQCWCDKETEMFEMNDALAVAFAKRLDAKDAEIALLKKNQAEYHADNLKRRTQDGDLILELQASNNELVKLLEETLDKLGDMGTGLDVRTKFRDPEISDDDLFMGYKDMRSICEHAYEIRAEARATLSKLKSAKGEL
jgi:hypothetical protein